MSAPFCLYPPIEPFDTGFLPVSDRHTLYYEQCGNPHGKPVVCLHGGPGSGTKPNYRRFFNPENYRIILFDQRGCGRSTPYADLQENTTWHLVADINALRLHLQIDRWQVFGGSWGSTLALAYAQTHPEQVSELILRGIFLLRRQELEWFYQQGANRLFPDAWEKYLAPIPLVEQSDLMGAYYRRLTSEDDAVRKQAAKAWSTWEGSTCFLLQDEQHMATVGQDTFAEAFARIECHYFVHGGFFETDNQLLQNIDRIRHIPTVIVQGRYDIVCPMQSAWDLHRAFPEAELIIVDAAGHSMFEPGITRELVKATDQFFL